MEIDDAKWNYDARNYQNYIVKSGGKYDINWIINNTAILHFCGREKPWKEKSTAKFAVLYKHYMKLAERFSLQDSLKSIDRKKELCCSAHHHYNEDDSEKDY